MTYCRYGSEHTRERRWEDVSYEARWHYNAIVAECADSERFDCRIPMKLALRASDVPDPEAAIQSLVNAGIALITADDYFHIPDGELRHMPPPSLRDNRRKAQQRKWAADSRKRKGESQALLNESSQQLGEGTPEGVDPETGEIKEDSTSRQALREDLPQNRTEQNRTALSSKSLEVQETIKVVETPNCPGCGKPVGDRPWCCVCEVDS